MSGWQISGGTATYKLDAGFWDGTACPVPTPPSPPPEVPQDYCRCIVTFTAAYDCENGWVIDNGTPSEESNPSNTGSWSIDHAAGTAYHRVDSGVSQNGNCRTDSNNPHDVPKPDKPQDKPTGVNCRCIYTYTASYGNCETGWIKSGPVATKEKNPANTGSWEVNGQTATYRLDAGESEPNVACSYTPTAPSVSSLATPMGFNCRCIYTYTAVYNCTSKLWTVGSAQLSKETNPQETGFWKVDQQPIDCTGTTFANYRLDAGPAELNGECNYNPTQPNTSSLLAPDCPDMPKCTYTYTASYNCETGGVKKYC